MNVCTLDQEALLDALRDVEDPEIPINIVDLGLVVDVSLAGDFIVIELTFTSMGCPGMDMIVEDVRERLLRIPEVSGVDVKIVWDPVWTKDRLTEEGRNALRECGISV
jgi:phenylacetate-CoA oxygenase PaaJ subunit